MYEFSQFEIEKSEELLRSKCINQTTFVPC